MSVDVEPARALGYAIALLATDLRLRRLSADTVVVFGVTTDVCVSATIRLGAKWCARCNRLGRLRLLRPA